MHICVLKAHLYKSVCVCVCVLSICICLAQCASCGHLDVCRHTFACRDAGTEVKAITMHDMSLHFVEDGVESVVLLDI